MTEQNSVVPTQPAIDGLDMQSGQFMPAFKTFDDAYRYCDLISRSTLIPKGYQNRPADILVAMQFGAEVGLKGLQSLQSIAVVNGIPSLYGDSVLGLVRSSGLLEDFDEWLEVDGVRQKGSFPIQKWADENKEIVAVCMSKRKGMTPRTTTYSVNDAKRAKLWDKKKVYPNGDVVESPWCTTPQRMLMWRARGWNMRDNFGDVLKGMPIYEEVLDITQPFNPTEAIAAASQPETKGAQVLEKLNSVAEERGVEIPVQALVLTPVEPAQIPPGTSQASPEPPIEAKPEDTSHHVETPKPQAFPLRAEIIKLEAALRESPDGQKKLNMLLGALKVKIASGQAFVDAVPIEQHGFYLSQIKASLAALKEPKK